MTSVSDPTSPIRGPEGLTEQVVGDLNLRSVSAELRLQAEVSLYMPAASPVLCVLLRFQDYTNSFVAEHQPFVLLGHAS